MSAPDQRPTFELESYEDKSLPHHVELGDDSELIGHTILAVITNPAGPYCDGTEMIIVTETRCWMVIESEDGYGCDEKSQVSVKHYRASEKRVLTDYLSAVDMRHAGLCSQGEYDLLRKAEEDREEKKKAEKADRLRKQLAELEGGAK